MKPLLEDNIPPCPFCGKKVDLTDEDVLYPMGVYWRFNVDIGMRSYHGHADRLDSDEACFTLHCPVSSSGCGAEISGDSREGAIEAWCKRTNK